jgi:hypothetical protein
VFQSLTNSAEHVTKEKEPVARNGFIITGIVCSLFIAAITLGWSDLKDAINENTKRINTALERQSAVLERLRIVEETIREHERETRLPPYDRNRK